MEIRPECISRWYRYWLFLCCYFFSRSLLIYWIVIFVCAETVTRVEQSVIKTYEEDDEVELRNNNNDLKTFLGIHLNHPPNDIQIMSEKEMQESLYG